MRAAFFFVQLRDCMLSRSDKHLVWMMGTTDRGPNELAAKRLIQCIVKDLPNFFYLPGSCYEHAAHLGVLGGLHLIDRMLETHGRKWRYFSAISMITNTLRDQAPALFSAWRALFGDADALANVKALFPRCVAERWGSVAQTEKRFLQAGVPRLSKAVNYIFQACPKLLSEVDDPGGVADAVDQISAEDRKAYKKKMGRCRHTTVSTLQDPLFEAVLEVTHAAMEPFIHLSNFLKKKLPAGVPGHLFQLVCGKASALLHDFDDMIFSSFAAMSSECAS